MIYEILVNEKSLQIGSDEILPIEVYDNEDFIYAHELICDKYLNKKVELRAAKNKKMLVTYKQYNNIVCEAEENYN